MYHIFLAYFSGLFLREYSSNSYGQTYGTFTYLHQLDPEIPVPAGWLLFRVYYPSTTCFFLDFVDHHGIHLCGGWFSCFFLGVVFHHVELQNLKAAQRCGPKITASSMLDKKRLGAMGSRVFPGTALDLMWNDGFCLVGNHPHNMLPGLVNIQKTIENGHRNSWCTH